MSPIWRASNPAQFREKVFTARSARRSSPFYLDMSVSGIGSDAMATICLRLVGMGVDCGHRFGDGNGGIGCVAGKGGSALIAELDGG